jgi:dTMP kinase
MRELLQQRGFRRLLVGQTVSALGDWTATVALMVLILDLTGSAAAVGGILVLRLLPAAVAAPLAARAAERWERRRTMLAMDGARAGMVLLLPWVTEVWWVYMWAFLIEVASIVFLPARDSAVPELVGDGDLGTANAMVLGTSYGTIPLGAGLFGLVAFTADALGWHGRPEYAVVFLIDSATFLVSYAAVRGIPTLGVDQAAQAAGGGERRGFRDALRVPLVRAILPVAAIVTIGIGTLFSTGVTFVEEVLGASQVQFAVLIALFGVGAGLGLAAHRWAGSDSFNQVRLGLVLVGGLMALISLVTRLWVAFIAAVGFGAAGAATLVAAMALVQKRTAGRERDLTFTAFHVVIRAGLAVSAVGSGIAVDLVGGVDWPVVGALAPARVVLLAAGLFVMLSSMSMRFPAVRPTSEHG